MRARVIALVLVVSCLVGCGRLRFVVDVGPAVDELQETIVLRDAGSSARDSVALVEVTGIIVDAQKGFLRPGANPVSRFTEALAKAAADSDVKAIIVRINSPGGGVTATDVMYRELLRFKARTKKPVVVLMADVAASGGYYLACGADEIVAHPTTITGSIGVIMQLFDLSDGMRRIGIRSEAITSGPNKAAGSPFEPMTPERRATFQAIVDEFYGAFRTVVETNRPELDPAALHEVTDGRIVSGRRALEVGLVDTLGDLHDAFAAAKTRAGITKGRLVKYHEATTYAGSPYASAPSAPTEASLVNISVDADGLGREPGFYFLWDPAAW